MTLFKYTLSITLMCAGSCVIYQKSTYTYLRQCKHIYNIKYSIDIHIYYVPNYTILFDIALYNFITIFVLTLYFNNKTCLQEGKLFLQ